MDNAVKNKVGSFGSSEFVLLAPSAGTLLMMANATDDRWVKISCIIGAVILASVYGMGRTSVKTIQIDNQVPVEESK